jgi:hypothetical protein
VFVGTDVRDQHIERAHQVRAMVVSGMRGVVPQHIALQPQHSRQHHAGESELRPEIPPGQHVTVR